MATKKSKPEPAPAVADLLRQSNQQTQGLIARRNALWKEVEAVNTALRALEKVRKQIKEMK